MRLIARIPADLGKVASVSVQVRYAGTEDTDAVDVTDVQLQPGDATGVVPNPADVAIRRGGPEWRNGVIPRSVDEVIVMANGDRAAPTRIDVRPARPATVRVGSFRFGRVLGSAWADGQAGKASQGWGRIPVITERSNGHVPVTADQPVHVTVAWSDRS